MGHILRAVKKGAHVTHRVLNRVSPVYHKAYSDHENRVKLRKQKRIRKQEREYHRGRHQ
jgi:hypothetical protein